MKWEVIKKEEIYKDEWKGLEKWMFRSEGCVDKGITIQTARDSVVVFGITDEEKVLFIKEYYFALEKHIYSLVAGMVDDGKTPEQIAKSELLEEAGCEAEEIISLGSFCLGKYVTGRAHLFLAKGVKKVQEQSLEDCEDIEVNFVGLNEFKKMLENGEIGAIPEVAASYRALKYLNKL